MREQTLLLLLLLLLLQLCVDVTKRGYFAHIDILQVIRIAYLFLSISTPLSRKSAFYQSNECAFFHINIFVIGQWKHCEHFRRIYSCDKDIHILPNIDIL